jgi:ribokinase
LPAVRVVADCDVLLLQLEIPVDTALAAARQARSAGAVVMVNASPAGADPHALAELAALTDVVVLNESEAAHWQWTVPHRVITRGADGATYLTDGEEVAVPAPTVEAIDTTGAGDVFAGVLAAGWTDDPHYALRRACAAGALATLVSGAGDCAPYDETIEDAVLAD